MKKMGEYFGGCIPRAFSLDSYQVQILVMRLSIKILVTQNAMHRMSPRMQCEEHVDWSHGNILCKAHDVVERP